MSAFTQINDFFLIVIACIFSFYIYISKYNLLGHHNIICLNSFKNGLFGIVQLIGVFFPREVLGIGLKPYQFGTFIAWFHPC